LKEKYTLQMKVYTSVSSEEYFS